LAGLLAGECGAGFISEWMGLAAVVPGRDLVVGYSYFRWLVIGVCRVGSGTPPFLGQIYFIFLALPLAGACGSIRRQTADSSPWRQSAAPYAIEIISRWRAGPINRGQVEGGIGACFGASHAVGFPFSSF
jgi:hypothetical protein